MRSAFIFTRVGPEEPKIEKAEYPVMNTNDAHYWAKTILGADYFRGQHLDILHSDLLAGYDLAVIPLLPSSLNTIRVLRANFPKLKIVGIQDGSCDDYERADTKNLQEFYITLKHINAIGILDDRESIKMHWSNIAPGAMVDFLPMVIPTDEIKKYYSPARQRFFPPLPPSIMIANAPSRGKGFFLNLEFIARALGETRFNLYCQSANQEDDSIISDWWLRKGYGKEGLLLFRTMDPPSFWRVLSSCAMAVSFDYWYTWGRISGDAACVGTYCVGSNRTFLQHYLFNDSCYDPIFHIDRIFLLAECLRSEGLKSLYENHGSGEIEYARRVVELFNPVGAKAHLERFLSKVM